MKAKDETEIPDFHQSGSRRLPATPQHPGPPRRPPPAPNRASGTLDSSKSGRRGRDVRPTVAEFRFGSEAGGRALIYWRRGQGWQLRRAVTLTASRVAHRAVHPMNAQS